MNIPDITSEAICQHVFSTTATQFHEMALDVFRFQYVHNELYQKYCKSLRIDPEQVASIVDIPFLPIQFFKSHDVRTGSFEPVAVFESSGTTGSVNSRHLIKDLSLYENSFLNAFTLFYGNPNQYCILGLLPSYLERKNASLVYMADRLIKESNHPDSGFYLNEHEQLHRRILENESLGIKTFLIGVSFALIDFFTAFPMQLKHTIVMETGGMKGRRAEMTKASLHELLSKKCGAEKIHSEYGMTELLSQGYSYGDGIFKTPPWMKIVIRAEDNPVEIINPDFKTGNSIKGAVNVIDLANIYSCAFIATEDMGKLYSDGSFEILGRMDNSDVRGCSQMMA